jgi:hypothetical protein
MALPKKVQKVDLRNKYQYALLDDSPFSDGLFNIVDFPERLTAGKNLFKLRANNDILVNDSPIYIEVLDFNGNPIYYEPLQYIEKDGTRVVSIYIFPDTSPGPATVYLAGRVTKAQGRNIPFSTDFNSPFNKEIPNAIWERKVPVAPFAGNSTEIIFTTQPSMTITEVVQPYLQPVNIFDVFTKQTSSLAGATLSIDPQPSTIATTAEATAAPEGATSAGTPNFGTQFFDTSKLESSLTSTSGNQMDSPPLNTLSGFSKLTVENFPLTTDMIGGVLEIKDPIITVPASTGRNSNNEVIPSTQTATEWNNNSPSFTTSQTLSGSIKFAITDVLTSTTGRVAQYAGFKNEADNTFGPFAIALGIGAATSDSLGNISQAGVSTINKIDSANDFTASFIKPTEVVFTENSSSFADIILSNIEPETGDVFRVKTLYKPSGFFGDFLDLGDTILERQNILIDTASFETNVSVGTAYEQFGNFESLQEIQQYWRSGSVLNGVLETSTPTNATTFAYNEDTLIGGSELTPTWSPNQYTASVDNATIFSIKPLYHQTLYKDTTYIVKFQVALPNDIGLYTSEDTNIPNNRLDVYVSGSGVEIDNILSNVSIGEINPVTSIDTTLQGVFANGNELGNRIGTVRCKSVPGVTANIKLEFRAKDTAPFDLKFVTRRGSWIVGEVVVEADKQTGFSPNYIRIFKRIPTEHLKTPLTFKFQYYDFRGNKADLETIAYGAIFNGGNTYIDGESNLITGSAYIGNQVGTGLVMSGKNSGYIASTKYEGFTSASEGKAPAGWLMWSGSSNLTLGSDTYEGVGLELIANSESFFRYRSTPSEVIIKTDKFFFGSETTQFISGSNGVLEISSSNFHLTPEGNVTASNALFSGTALANAILNKTVTITTANSGSYFDEVIADDVSNTPAYNLVLDGSNGGEIVTSVNINCALARPIFKYVIPDYGSGAESTDIRIENNNANTKILNTFVSKGSSAPGLYDQIDVTNGAVLVLAVRGTSLSTQNSYPIAGTENISGLSTDGYLVRRNLRVGDGDSSGGEIIISGSVSGLTSFMQDRLKFQVGEGIVGVAALRLTMGTGKTTTTTATIIGAKTVGNWNKTSFIGHDPNNLTRAHLVISGSGGTTADRRLLINAGTHYGTNTSTSTTTYAVEDADNIIVNDHTSGTKTITLPAGDVEEGRMITIIHVNAGGAQTNVSGGIYVPGSAIPDTTRTSTTANSSMTVLYTHTRNGWIVINQNGTWS